ncbi:hypothetical protein LAZ67_1002024, partial [Cordylochernes scorpioides]
MATNFIRAESPSKAEQKPVRHGLTSTTMCRIIRKSRFAERNSNSFEKNQNYVNPPAGGQDANSAAPVDLAAIPTSNAAAQVRRNWADITEEVNPGAEKDLPSSRVGRGAVARGIQPTTAAPSSNAGASRTIRRPQSSAGSVPRAQEIRATRAHIADARARQASSSEEHCVYIEHSPELEPFHYLRALDRMLGGTAGVIQITKVNGHQLLGLTNRGLAERLISEGLEVEGTLLRAFPFRKRAERITVGNLPFFVADSAVITALSPYGRVTSIAPKQMKAGPLRLRRWPARPSGLQPQHRTWRCPSWRRPTASSASSTRNATGDDLVAFIEGNPSVSFARTDALGLGREEVLDLLSSRTKAQRNGPLLSPPQCDALVGLIGQILDLKPGHTSNLYKVLGQVRAELTKTPAAAPTPPLPAPRPTGPTPPVPHEEQMTEEQEDVMIFKIFRKLKHMTCLRPLYDTGIDVIDLKDAILFTEDTASLMTKLSPALKGVLAEFLGAAIELARSYHHDNEIPIVLRKNQNYVNPPAGGQDANSAAPVDLAAIPTSNAAAQVRRNWADITEEVNPGAEEGFTLVQGRKRRRGSANSPTAAAPSSNPGGSRTIRRPQPSAGSVPRAQEIRVTRAHIAEARARQASSSEEHCVYIEHSPELEPFHYLRALDRMLGGTAGVIQITKVNGHQLLGLTNRGLAERLISEGLEVEGTLLRAFPFRKRAERITVGLANNTRMAPPTTPAGVPPPTTSAPPQRAPPMAQAVLHPSAPRPSPPAAPALPMEETPSTPPPVTPAPSLQAPEVPVGPRPAKSQHPEPTPPARPDFVALRDPLKTQVTLGPAAPTPDVEMSIVEETTASSTSAAKNATRVDLDAFIEVHPSVSFAEMDALGLGREEVLDLLSSRTKAQRKGPLLSPPQCDALAGLIGQILDLKPGHTSNLYKVLGQVRAELTKTPAAAPTPPLPAPRPAETAPPAPQGEESAPAEVAYPPPLPVKMTDEARERWLFDLFKELNYRTFLMPLLSWTRPEQIIRAALHSREERNDILGAHPNQRSILANFLGSVIEHARGDDQSALDQLSDFRRKLQISSTKIKTMQIRPPADIMQIRPRRPTSLLPRFPRPLPSHRSWADLAEDNNQESEDPFITVQRKKRRRGSAESPAAAAPSSNIRGAGAIRRPRSSTGWAPRAEEIRTTRAHIVEARARQASSTEDHCVYVERSPELEPFHYMRAIERMFGGTREVFQLTKMNGHFLVGLANRGMAERLVNEGLEVEGTLHRAFPFRKRAERITVGNLPFFVGDAAVISALSSFGRVTSIAPKLMKAGPYIYNDGRREAFIILREGMTIERLPTRLDITIKGEAWPAYLSSGIRCSRCRGQGHRRANCPLLARRTTAPGPATPTSPTSVPPATAPRLPQQPSAQPPPPASPSPTMEVSDVPPTSRAALHPPAATPEIITSAFGLTCGRCASCPSTNDPCSVPANTWESRACGPNTGRGDVHRGGDLCVLHEELTPPLMTPPPPAPTDMEEDDPMTEKERDTPPPPAPRLAETTPPIPHGEKTSPHTATPPPPLSCQFIDDRWTEADDILYELNQERDWGVGISESDITEAVIYPEDREPLIRRLSTRRRSLLAAFISAAIERARDADPFVREGITRPWWVVTACTVTCLYMQYQAMVGSDCLYCNMSIHAVPGHGGVVTACTVSTPHVYTCSARPWWGSDCLYCKYTTCLHSAVRPRVARAPECFASGGRKVSRMATNFIRAESPSKAEQKPVRHGSLAKPCAELSANQDLQNEIPIVLRKNQNYVNPPAGGQDANSAAPVDLAAIPTSNAAAQVRRNWADIKEEVNPGAEEGFTLVQGRKRRRGSGNSPTTAAPSSNAGASRPIRRPQSSAGSVPRAQEIRATRAHIAEARARQASSSEEHCVYIEHSPELEPFHYLRALDRKLGGTAGVIQITKVNGHQLLGLTNRGLAERLISEGLEVEGTLLRAFPFRKRAERITVGNLPFFVADSAVITALSPYGRVTSIAPKQMKAGPYVYVDGRRDVFITLHEGITIERLPTRLDINIKGQAWPAYLSSGIRCSRCHGQGHRRAICPLLAGLANNTRMAPPTTPACVPPPTTSAPPQRAPPMAQAVLHPSAPRPSPPAAPALPMEETPSTPPPPQHQHPPLPAPRPAETAPPAPQGEESAPAEVAYPPPLPVKMTDEARERWLLDLFKELNYRTFLMPLLSWTRPEQIIRAALHSGEERNDILGAHPNQRSILANFLGSVIERARGDDQSALDQLSDFRAPPGFIIPSIHRTGYHNHDTINKLYTLDTLIRLSGDKKEEDTSPADTINKLYKLDTLIRLSGDKKEEDTSPADTINKLYTLDTLIRLSGDKKEEDTSPADTINKLYNLDTLIRLSGDKKEEDTSPAETINKLYNLDTLIRLSGDKKEEDTSPADTINKLYNLDTLIRLSGDKKEEDTSPADTINKLYNLDTLIRL